MNGLLNLFHGSTEECEKLNSDLRGILDEYLNRPLTEFMMSQIATRITQRLMDEVQRGNLPPFEDKYEIMVRRYPLDPTILEVWDRKKT